jgi:uncharacterized alpha-E superfamily protein
MLSRVADSLYWMSRYLERAENTVRQLDVTMSLMLDTGGASAETRWQRMMARWASRRDGVERRSGVDGAQAGLRQPQPRSVTFCVNGARENARQVREEISTEQWQRLNRLFHQMHSPQAQAQFSSSINDAAGFGHRWHSSLQGRQRHHHDSRPGLAVHPPGPLP